MKAWPFTTQETKKTREPPHTKRLYIKETPIIHVCRACRAATCPKLYSVLCFIVYRLCLQRVLDRLKLWFIIHAGWVWSRYGFKRLLHRSWKSEFLKRKREYETTDALNSVKLFSVLLSTCIITRIGIQRA